MISTLVSFLYFSYLFSDYLEINQEGNENCAIFGASLIFAIASNGLIAMLLVATGTIYFPIFLIQIIIFFVLVDINKFKKLLVEHKLKISSDLLTLKNRYGKNFLKLISLIIVLLLFTSFGPINHSDTANYYVGYPFQYYLRNSHFIDGDLGQGLLGIGDFSNLVFIQEKSIWLIRVAQFLPLLPILFFLGKRKVSGFIILIFITSPVFLQWLTIGKITFIGDSCLSLIYLCWKEKPSEKYALITFLTGLITISIKISSLLIFIPILLDILNFYKFNIKTVFQKIKSSRQRFIALFLTISIGTFLSILFYRFYVTGNLFFPILSSVFSRGDKQLYEWEMMLRKFDREGFYQFWIFIPKNPSKVASVLGPATGFLFLIKMWKNISLFSFKNKFPLNVGFAQLIMLFLFAQGRADYYFSPLLLIVSDSGTLLKDLENNKNYLLIFNNKIIFKITFFIQSSLFIFSTFYMITLNLYAIVNYENVMDRTAYGYYNAKVINNNVDGLVMSLIENPVRLFYVPKFVPNHKYWKCVNYDFPYIKNKEEFCMKKLEVDTVIVEKNYLRDKNFECKTKLFRQTPRNIFRSFKYSVDFCKVKKS